MVVTPNFELKNDAATWPHSWRQPLPSHSKYYFSNAQETFYCSFYFMLSFGTMGRAAGAIFEVDIVNWVTLGDRYFLDCLVKASFPFSTNSCFARELAVPALQCLFWYPELVREIVAVRGRANLRTC